MYRNLINYNDTSYEELSALSLRYENGNQDLELISCASRYLLDYKSKCSTNQVQPLAKVWTVKHFRSYRNRAIFGVVNVNGRHISRSRTHNDPYKPNYLLYMGPAHALMFEPVYHTKLAVYCSIISLFQLANYIILEYDSLH